MLGLVMAGFIVVAALCFMSIAWSSPYEELSLAGGEVRRELPAFSQLEFKTAGNVAFYDSDEGIIIKESDSIAAPYVVASENLVAALVPRLAGDTLRLTLDFDVLVDTMPEDQRERRTFVSFSGSSPAKIVVPRGMMRGVRSKCEQLFLEGFDAPSIRAEVYRRLVLTDCRLDTLRCASASLNSLELIDSQVGYAGIRQPKNKLKVVTEGEVCGIARMDVSGDRRNDGSRLNLYRANVGEVNWIPTDSAARINVVLGKPARIGMR